MIYFMNVAVYYTGETCDNSYINRLNAGLPNTMAAEALSR